MTEPVKNLSICVKGKVQGVFFRATTRTRAQALGITGWVCNQADGAVYLEAEGSPQQLEKLIKWLHEGPPAAVVEEVKSEPGKLMHYQDFSVH